jgi:hypothetical protein
MQLNPQKQFKIATLFMIKVIHLSKFRAEICTSLVYAVFNCSSESFYTFAFDFSSTSGSSQHF